MIKKVICALMLGVIVSIVLFQRDPVIQHRVGSYCTDIFQRVLACRMSMKVKSINLFTGTITFSDVTAQPHDGNGWAWRSEQLMMSFTFWELISAGKIAMHIQFKELKGKTTIANGSFGIVPHIINAMNGFSPDVPINLRSITFLHAQLDGSDKATGSSASISWNSILKFTNESFKASFHCTDGYLSISRKRCFDMVDGAITFDLPYSKEYWLVASDLRFHLPQLPQAGINCFFAGSLRSGLGSFSIRSIDDSLEVNPVSIDVRSHTVIFAKARLPLNYLVAIAMQQQANSAFGGKCIGTISYDSKRSEPLSGTLTCSDCSYKGVHFATDSTVTFAQKNSSWQGTLNWHYADWLGAHGDWAWNGQSKTGSVRGSNNVPLVLWVWPDWQIPLDSCSFSCTFDTNYHVNGAYNAIAKNKKTDAKLQLAGTASIDEHDIAVRGNLDEQLYNFVMQWAPTLGIKELNVSKKTGASQLNLHGRLPDYRRFAGTVSLDGISAIIENSTTVSLTGEGTVDLYGIIEYPRLALKTCFSHGAIRLPQIYNCINELEAIGTVDIEARKIQLRSLQCKLYEGSLQCTKANVTFNEQWQPTFVYAPLILDHCLLNMKKDLFAAISGDLLFVKDEQALPRLTGHLIFNRSHLADNIFSGAFHETISQFTKNTLSPHGSDMACDLNIETQHPIHVKTSFFDTQATSALQVHGRIYAPEIAGTVTLDGGSLLFPYKPLHIIKGMLTVNAQQLDDPLIELVAKNKIKKYLISLDVQGSLKHYQMSFSSNPPLSEEQIIGLLLLGSEGESLGNMAPALVMSNVKNLIVGSDPESFLNRYLASALQPFKNVHFIPSFSDQSGRGGLRGTVEIDINDRWRAMVQKNFNLSEDTHCELEYLLSDEVSLKGIRDEHRDISGEVEMRFKF